MFEYASNGTLYEHLHCKFFFFCPIDISVIIVLDYRLGSSRKIYNLIADGEGCQLSWIRRMRIVIGIARGLKYLHTELQPPFTLSELNSSSIYLTEDFSPKVG